MENHQYSLVLIQRSVNGSVIEQRSGDGYINATALCQVAGKQWFHYVREENTGHFLRALAAKIGIAPPLLVEMPLDGRGNIWVHPRVALHLAQWLSADFAVQVTEWVHEWMSGNGAPAGPAQLPNHLARYLANDGQVPPGYFSVLQETGLNLFGPLHNIGFEIPKGWVPDISVGLLFCKWLREERGVDTDALPTYMHTYLDHRKAMPCKLYPEDFLLDFRRWFRSTWLPKHGVQYFKKKDPNSMPYLDKLPALAGPKTVPPLPGQPRA
ncbi:KilA-N domain-containing protein (plasmid) [Cupriavidus metallidurans]|uniref:KilA-N domain-containing protein n=1 Tax=Cupriavidus metallidurans TaxID=119219 RepID=UPI003D73E6E7